MIRKRRDPSAAWARIGRIPVKLRIADAFHRFAAATFALAIASTGCGGGSAGSDGESPGPEGVPSSWVLRWNRIAVDASGFDHANAGEQLGPGKAARAMAIVHLAMFDAANGIRPAYASYLAHASPAPNASLKAAIAQAAHDTLRSLFRAQAARFDDELLTDLAHVDDVDARDAGIKFGSEVATAILANRAFDHADLSTPTNEAGYPIRRTAGHWRPDPLQERQLPLGPYWGQVTPFVLGISSQFRVPPPPALSSAAYAEAYDEVKRLGGDGAVTPTERTPEQSQIGIYWAYDGTPSLCAPPRLYNQITVQIARDRGTEDPIELARLLALANVAMADAGIAIWESKYYYDLWRPVTGIRESDTGTGPTGTGDGNPETLGDPTFTPMGAPASNLSGTDFTPPFPAYPSGHAGFGGALFETLRQFYGTDAIPFSFVSDELNGVTVDYQGNVRPLVERSFASLSEAEEENGQSRIYLGIHWSFDKTQGIAQGRAVADYVFETILRPLAPIVDR